MNSLLSTTDLIIFFGSLVAIMGVGLWAGRKEDSSEDYFLAGKNTRWWGVAGSIFGSNVSANHIVGMMGVGFAVGFAQSHFEITAIAGLLMLCYFFLPVYRKLNVFTLSDYLSKRYDDRSRISYALIMVIIMVVIQMVPGFYIGSRSINLLLQGDTGRKAIAEAVVTEDGQVSEIKVLSGGEKYGDAPGILFNGKKTSSLVVEMEEQRVKSVSIIGELPSLADKTAPVALSFYGGNAGNPAISPGDVDPFHYQLGILIMAIVTGAYVILGGLKAVIVTDVIQSVLLLLAGLLVAFITFSQPEVGGWANMTARDLGPEGADRLHLYNASNHGKLPWTGVLTGLMVLHFYYWGTNQFIVQRALSARSDKEARMGILAAGFFKLLIPFFSIGTGIAAYYLFKDRNLDVAQDAVFIKLLTELIAPIGFGLVGLIAAGMIGAILSSLDSMMNSAATIMTFDIYKRYLKPDATDKQLISMGRIWIVVFIVLAGILTIFTMDPNSQDSFFLHVAKHQGNLIAGVVVAFALGMLWKRATAAGGVAAIVSGVIFSYSIPPIYAIMAKDNQSLIETFGSNLNFLHGAFLSALLSLVVHILVSRATRPDEEKGKMTWTGLGIFSPTQLAVFAKTLLFSLTIYGLLGALVYLKTIEPVIGACIGGAWTFGCFYLAAQVKAKETGNPVYKEDRFWAGGLAGCAIFMMYYFF
ncbi:MAG: sodium/solute symporter [Opitutae bacterium]|jgi:solute:Na+ symporter, SSS family|nr:sodium/solute symporter [Opitutae bacterium]